MRVFGIPPFACIEVGRAGIQNLRLSTTPTWKSEEQAFGTYTCLRRLLGCATPSSVHTCWKSRHPKPMLVYDTCLGCAIPTSIRIEVGRAGLHLRPSAMPAPFCHSSLYTHRSWNNRSPKPTLLSVTPARVCGHIKFSGSPRLHDCSCSSSSRWPVLLHRPLPSADVNDYFLVVVRGLGRKAPSLPQHRVYLWSF
jgi:hypothetical protein